EKTLELRVLGNDVVYQLSVHHDVQLIVREDTLSLHNLHLRWNVQIHRLQNDCLLQDLYGQASTACQSMTFLICSSSVAQILVVDKQIEYILPGGPVSFRRHQVN